MVYSIHLEHRKGPLIINTVELLTTTLLSVKPCYPGSEWLIWPQHKFLVYEKADLERWASICMLLDTEQTP